MSANIINAARRLIKHINQQFGDYEQSPTAKLARDLEIAISAEIKTPDFGFGGDENGGPGAELVLPQEREAATVLNEQQKEAVNDAVKRACPDLYEELGTGNAQSLFEAIVGRATDRITTKHDPYCDCGICQYCNGDEDKFGNPTRKNEVESIRSRVLITASIECSECDDAKTENLQGGNLRTLRPEFALTAWKHGWIVEADKVLCPMCRGEDTEWEMK
jgi:hypothetical protein